MFFKNTIAATALTGAFMIATTAASAATLNFEGITTSGGLGQQGTISGTEIPGVTISLSGNNAGMLGLYNSACRQDNSAPNCTGGDADLATGAGLASSGTAPLGTVDTPAEGFILISSEGSGGTFGDKVGSPLFTFEFAVPTFINSFVLIDIDENPNQVQAIFTFSDGSPILSFSGSKATSVLNAGKDNSYSLFDIAAIAGSDLLLAGLLAPVDKFQIQFNSISGGIASIHATPVPVPAALPLLVSALGLMGWLSRHRKTA